MGPRAASPAGVRAAPRLPSPPMRRRWRSAPTPAARSASPPAVCGDRRHEAHLRTARPGTDWWRSPSRSTHRVRSPTRCSTPRCCTRPSSGHDPLRLHLGRCAGPPVVGRTPASADCRACDRRGGRVQRRRLSSEVTGQVQRGRRLLDSLGAEVVEVSLPALHLRRCPPIT